MDDLDPRFLMWDADMPLLNNRFFLYDLGKVLFGAGGLFLVLSLAIATAKGNMQVFGSLMILLGCSLLVVAFLLVAVALMFFGNSYPVRYLISAEGLGYELLSRRGKATSRLAIFAGLLAGDPGLVGAALLSASRQSGLVSWQRVRKIRAYPAIGVVSVMDGWHVIFRFYCTPGYYTSTINWLRRAAPGARYLEFG